MHIGVHNSISILLFVYPIHLHKLIKQNIPCMPSDLEQSLAHAVHDHVKRDHLLCLSTANGNTYYLQVYIHTFT